MKFLNNFMVQSKFKETQATVLCMCISSFLLREMSTISCYKWNISAHMRAILCKNQYKLYPLRTEVGTKQNMSQNVQFVTKTKTVVPTNKTLFNINKKNQEPF